MKANQTILLGIVAALAVVAAVLWGTKPEPKPVAPPTPPRAAKPSEAAPVAPPAPTTPTEAAALVARATTLPINPTQTGELPPMREARAYYGVVDSPEQLAKLFDEAVKSTGGEAVQRPLMAAKWKLTVAMPGRTLFLDMLTDREGNLSATDEQTGVEWFLVNDECHIRRGKLVGPCLTEGSEFIHGLHAGQIGTLPLRLKDMKIPMESVLDGKDVVRVTLPTVAEHTPMRMEVSREYGAVSAIEWCSVTAIPERRRVDNEWAIPDGWAMNWAPPQKERKTQAKDAPKVVAWRASVRVTSLEPRKDKALIKLPELSAGEPMSVTSRPALTGVVAIEGARPPDDKLAGQLAKLAGFEGLIDLMLGQVFAPAQKVPALTQGAETWMLLPPQAAARYAKAMKLRELPAEQRIVRKVIRARWSDLPDQMVKFVGEATAAGYTLGTGPTVVMIIPSEDPEALTELQIPLAGK